MSLSQFIEFHRPALERDEVRHNLILGLSYRLIAAGAAEARWWTLGSAGECAIQTSPQRPLILGALSPDQCREFAAQTAALDYTGVVGIEDAAPAFVERARECGLEFAEPMPELIRTLERQPNPFQTDGTARLVAPTDLALFLDWTTAFAREAVPHGPLPSREQLEETIAEKRYQFWTVDGEPVAMAGIARRTRRTGAISGVYTPPPLRRRGYAGAVTAAVVDSIFAEGRTSACLYSDLRNPASNRCYARMGFAPVCRAWNFVRR